MMKKSISLLVLVLIALSMSAQSDFDIAQSFMNKKGIKLVDNPCRTRGVGKPYSIFTGEENKGFAIVINGCVIGYGTEEITESDELPCGLEGLLNTYPQVTRPMMTRSEKQNYVPDWWEKEKRENLEPIGPLLTTKWNQTPPYEDSLDVKSGFCSMLAMAQILHYYKMPHIFGEKGEQIGDTLHVIKENRSFNNGVITYAYDTLSIPIVEFHHELMLDKYFEPITGKLGSDEERAAVANFLRTLEILCGKIIYAGSDKNIFTDILGIKIEGNYFEPEGEEHGNYYWWDYWLEKKMPIYAVGNGHAFVVDGRNSEGRYHINFGWGGLYDGYYILPNTPEQCKEYLTDENKVSWLPCTISTPIVYCPLFEWTPPSQSTFISNNVVFNTSHNDNVYNLKGENNGNTLNGLPKGVYIQNKKKQVVK